MKINRKSWHYRFVMFTRDCEPRDFCAYGRAFLGSVLGWLTAGLIGLGVLVCTGDFLGWLVACVLHLLWITPEPLAAGFIAIAVTVGFLVTLAVMQNAESLATVRGAVRARKERFCPIVSFTD